VQSVRGIVKRIVRTVGYDIIRYDGAAEYPPDFTPSHNAIIRAVRPYTMTSPERLHALIEAVRYVVRSEIPGDIVECGVWRGGSMMAAALTLRELNQTDRQLYLFDTFEGMPRPSAVDTSFRGEHAIDIFEALKTGEDSSKYCRAQFEKVRAAVASTGYPPTHIHLLKGKVEMTIPATAPESIALLRLDTDWHESTSHELEHLFPRLSHGGVLIVDDYGHWEGCKRAVDEYFEKKRASVFLARIDYTGRIGIKM
jgi:O-methyltransferase